MKEFLIWHGTNNKLIAILELFKSIHPPDEVWYTMMDDYKVYWSAEPADEVKKRLSTLYYKSDDWIASERDLIERIFKGE